MNPDLPPRPKHTVQTVQETTTEVVSTTAAMEFSKPEELLRYDREQTVVPENLARRVAGSAATIEAPSKPWWRRWF